MRAQKLNVDGGPENFEVTEVTRPEIDVRIPGRTACLVPSSMH